MTERIALGTGITLLAQRDPIWTAKEVASLDVISAGRVLFGVGYGWNVEEMASHGIASFDGRLLSLEPSWAWPKPIQQPHPPVLMGATIGPTTLAHLVEFCDGWIPIGRGDITVEVPQVRRALEDAGRDPDEFRFVYYQASRRRARLDELADLGFDVAVFGVDSGTPEQVIERLDELETIARDYER